MKLRVAAGPVTGIAGTPSGRRATCFPPACRGLASQVSPRLPRSCSFSSLSSIRAVSAIFKCQAWHTRQPEKSVLEAELAERDMFSTRAPELLPTLQTMWGMVTYGGRPQERDMDSSVSAAKLPSEALAGLAGPAAGLAGRQTQRKLLKLQACLADTSPTELKNYIGSFKRLDIEQAAALAVSQLPEQQALEVLKTIPTMLSSSCMWREPKDLDVPPDPAAAAAEKRLERLRSFVQSQGLQSNDGIEGLTITLMTIRRKRPAQNDRHRLCLPDCLLDSRAAFSEEVAGPCCQDLRKQWQEHYKRSQSQLQLGAFEGETKVVSKKNFSRLQRHLNKLIGDQSAAGKLNRSIDELENVVERGSGRYEALQATSDKLALAFSFVAIQRQRQLKVVSDNYWTTFLKKGEGVQVQQNNPAQLTSFELALWQMALSRPDHEIDWDALTAITTPDGPQAKGEDLMDLIDQTCLLMEQYLRIHGQGLYDNLRFQLGTSGGSGCGPVDSYNQLVDILRTLKTRAEQAGRPVSIEPCLKFLAKDIMAWNRAWDDDAFAPGRVPGWEGWLRNRRSMRILPFLKQDSPAQTPSAELRDETSAEQQWRQARRAG